MAYFETIAIEQLELSLRAYNCLKRAQILTLADLSRESYQSLLALRNFGQKSAAGSWEFLGSIDQQLLDLGVVPKQI